jgi:probable rRNA maturation factor
MVEIELSRETGEALGLCDDEFEGLAQAILAAEGVERPCLVSLTVTDDEGIRELNAEWRGADRATDVLSFECERPDDPDLAPGEACELGDIVMAPAYIRAQAARLGTDFRTETALLFTHGMLHLLGYDHLEDDEAAVMEAREDELAGGWLGVEGFHAATTRHRDDA